MNQDTHRYIIYPLFGIYSVIFGTIIYLHFFASPPTRRILLSIPETTVIDSPVLLLPNEAYAPTTTEQALIPQSTTTNLLPQTSPPQAVKKSPAKKVPSVSEKQIDRVKPTTPDGLVITQLTESLVSVSWEPSVDNVAVAGYKIFRDNIEVASTKNTQYGFIDLEAGHPYIFGVAAFDQAGNTSDIARLAFRTVEKPIPIATTTQVNSTPPPLVPISLCGNGVQDRGEECDDGNTTDTDSCRNTCKAAYCGDMVIWAERETCDDGNHIDTDLCMNNCMINPYPKLPGSTSSGSGSSGVSPSTSPSPNPTPSPSANPATYTINVTSSGVFDSTALTIHTGDTVNFHYSNPGDEIIVSFSPTPPASMTLDHEFTTRSYTFSQAGSWTFNCKGHSGSITVQ